MSPAILNRVNDRPKNFAELNWGIISQQVPVNLKDLVNPTWSYLHTDYAKKITQMQIAKLSQLKAEFAKFTISYVMFSLFWFGVKWLYTWKYSLKKAKLQLKNNNHNIYIKNKNDLKYFFYFIYKFLV